MGKHVLIPALTGRSSNPSGVLGSAGDRRDRSQLTLLGDTFSGYRLFQSESFQAALKESGTPLVYRDQVNQASRAEALDTGKADLILTTLDQFLRHRPKGQIVGLINRTVGADAAVLNRKKYPQLNSLFDLKLLVEKAKAKGEKLSVVYAGDTPSEYLAQVLDTKFETFNLSDFDVIKVADDDAAWAALKDESKNVAIAIVREPFVAQAQDQGYPVALSSQDTPKSIVDVLVASDQLLKSEPDQVSTLVETYYRRLDAQAESQENRPDNGERAPSDSAALDGIKFFSAPESKKWMEDGTLKQRINAISSVLVLSGQLDTIPADPEELYTAQPLVTAAENTQQLINLVQKDDPQLADKLKGLVARRPSPPKLSRTQIQVAPNIGNMYLQEQVQFPKGSIQLNTNDVTILDQLASELDEFNPETVAIRVIGHTAKAGPVEANKTLSRRRADVVVKYLQSKGVQQTMITEGRGCIDPMPDVPPEDARQQRTEIRLVRINAQKVSSL